MADNLLDKASILLTPTAYNDGRMLSVKPYENLYGSELVTNGDFSQGSTGWTVQSGTVNITDKAEFVGSSILRTSSSILTSGKKYKITYEITSITGSPVLKLYDGAWFTAPSTVGTHTVYRTINSVTFYLRNDSSNDITVDNVSVVEDLSGDFTFSRGSAATRVNAQGLVENVQIISSELVSNGNFSQIGTEEVLNGNFSQEGSELVTNGDFSNGLTNWSVNGGSYATIVDGALNSNNTENGNWFAENISQNISFVNGKTYKVTFKAKNISGDLNLRLTQGANVIYTRNLTSSFVDYEVYYTANADNGSVRIFCNDNVGQFQIDNISVKEVGQNWTFFGEAELTSQGARIYSSSGGQSYIVQSVAPLTTSKSYKFSYEITDSTQGSLKLINVNGLSDFPIPSTIGTHTVYFTADNSSFFVYRNSGVTDVTITNISVKEVGQDWTVTNSDANNYVEFNQEQGTARLKFLNTSPLTQLTSTAQYISGKKYKLIVDVAEVVSGGIKIDAAGVSQTYNLAGIQESIIQPTGTSFISFYRTTANVDVTLNSVSLKEITDDTDLPRINYSGFSYQDSLGSELVTNGSFDTDTSWNKQSGWVITNGYAESTALNTRSIYQNIGNAVVGKTYKITYTILETNGGNFKVVYGGVNGTIRNTTGTYIEYLKATSSADGTIYFDALNVFIGKIDNISVKEYLGQEVVPDSGCGSWLLEPQSTNLVTYSEDFSQWSSVSTSLTSGYLAPDGTLGATKISGTIGTSNIVLGSSSSTTATRTIWARTVSGTGTAKLMSFYQNTNNLFTLTEEWQRFELNGAISTGGTSFYVDFRDNSQTLNEFIIWGAQSEALSYATSYIPTNGATSTRLQDIANNSGNSTLINSTEGVLYGEILKKQDNNDDFILISLNNAASNSDANSVTIGFNSSYSFFLRVKSPSGSYTNQTIIANKNQFYKVALKYKSGDISVWIDGVEVATSTVAFSFAEVLDNLSFDFNGNGILPFYGKVKALAVYKEALTDAELQSLTTQ